MTLGAAMTAMTMTVVFLATILIHARYCYFLVRVDHGDKMLNHLISSCLSIFIAFFFVPQLLPAENDLVANRLRIPFFVWLKVSPFLESHCLGLWVYHIATTNPTSGL